MEEGKKEMTTEVWVCADAFDDGHIYHIYDSEQKCMDFYTELFDAYLNKNMTREEWFKEFHRICNGYWFDAYKVE